MKKTFICITSVLFTLFYCLIIQEKPDAMLFELYPQVTLLSLRDGADIENLKTDMDHLAREKNSLIGLRIAQPSRESGRTSRFSYYLFGEGTLPSGFVEAGENDVQRMNPVNSYVIFDGPLAWKDLAQTLEKYSDRMIADPSSHVALWIALRYLARPSLALSLFLFSLLFVTIISMHRIRGLRSSGIQVLSGIPRSKLFTDSLEEDVSSILLGFLTAGLFVLSFLLFTHLWNLRLFFFLLTGVAIYIVLLLILSVLLEFLFHRILKKSRLTALLKGKMPIKAVLAVLLAGQLIAFLGVGYGAHMITEVYPLYQAMNEGRKGWNDRSEYYRFVYNLGSHLDQKDAEEQRNLLWMDFVSEAFSDPNTLYCEHFLREMDSILPSREESRKILMVSPSYLKKEGILTDPAEQSHMEHLQEGEYGLILPRHLSDEQRNEAKNALQSYLKEHFHSEDAKNRIRFLTLESAKHDPVFVYNYDGKPPVQYLQDPYIIILTPTATGRSARAATQWAYNSGATLFFDSYERVDELLQHHELSPFVSHIINIKEEYMGNVEDYRYETISLLVGSIIGTITAAATFVVMNQLYFDHFRREIFIRRLSGLSFFQNHASYLALQGGILLVGFAILCLLSGKIILIFLVFLIFLMIETLLLFRQMKKENQSATTVLKGE